MNKPVCVLKATWTEPYQIANGTYETLCGVGRAMSDPIAKRAALQEATTVFNLLSLESLEVTKREASEFVEFISQADAKRAQTQQDAILDVQDEEPMSDTPVAEKTSETAPSASQRIVRETPQTISTGKRGRPRLYALCEGSNKAPSSVTNGMGQCSACPRRTHLDNGLIKSHTLK